MKVHRLLALSKYCSPLGTVIFYLFFFGDQSNLKFPDLVLSFFGAQSNFKFPGLGLTAEVPSSYLGEGSASIHLARYKGSSVIRGESSVKSRAYCRAQGSPPSGIPCSFIPVWLSLYAAGPKPWFLLFAVCLSPTHLSEQYILLFFLFSVMSWSHHTQYFFMFLVYPSKKC